MLTVSLVQITHYSKLSAGKLVVAKKQPFSLEFNSNAGNISALTYDTNALPGGIVTINLGVATLTFASGIPVEFSAREVLFTATVGSGEESTALFVTIVPEYAVKKQSAHEWFLFNYDIDGTVFVQIINLSDNSVFLDLVMSPDSKSRINLPDDGMYSVRFTNGMDSVYAYIIDTSTSDKIFTDMFRKVYCCSCDTSKKTKYYWEQLMAYREAMLMVMGQLADVGLMGSINLFDETLGEYLKADEIRQKYYDIAKKTLSCQSECSCGC